MEGKDNIFEPFALRGLRGYDNNSPRRRRFKVLPELIITPPLDFRNTLLILVTTRNASKLNLLPKVDLGNVREGCSIGVLAQDADAEHGVRGDNLGQGLVDGVGVVGKRFGKRGGKLVTTCYGYTAVNAQMMAC